MKQLAQLGLLLALTFTLVPKANAGILLEPVVGFNVASKVEVEDLESYSGGGGLGYGGRVGYQNLGFQLGLDYLNSSIDMGDDDFDKNVDTSEWAAFVGFEFPVLLRVYAGYIFSATGKTEYNNSDLELSKGSGMKVGAGLTVLPFLDINLEYRKGSFDEAELGGTEIDNKVDYSSVFLGVSLPFVI